MANFTEADIRKAISEAKQRRIAEEKRKFYEAKKARQASSDKIFN